MAARRRAARFSEWMVPVQTLNAYCQPRVERGSRSRPPMLQPPIFDADADDAANYGALGALMGHELLSHALDDGGQAYDARGVPRHWSTPADARDTSSLVGGMCSSEIRRATAPIRGLHVNRRSLTLAESLADVNGLSLACRAYHNSLAQAHPAHPSTG